MNIFIEILIDCLPEIAVLIISLVSAIIGKKIVPFIKAKLDKVNVEITKEQLEDVKTWIEMLVNSAQRLDKAGNLGEITKKEYVETNTMIYIQSKGYEFTEEQIDIIRRSLVYLMEQAEIIVNNAADEIVRDVVVE